MIWTQKSLTGVEVVAAMFEDKYLPYFVQYRAKMFPATGGSSPKQILLSLDGDMSTLKALFKTPSKHSPEKTLIQLFHEKKIAVSKWASACTHDQQPEDVSTSFRSLKRLAMNPKYHEMVMLVTKIRKDFTTFVENYFKGRYTPDERKSVSKHVKLMEVILPVAFARFNVQQGWKNAGLVPFKPEVIFNRHWGSSNARSGVTRTLLDAVEPASVVMGLNGEVKEDYMDNWKIDRTPNQQEIVNKKGKDKGQGALCTRRFVILSHQKIMEEQLQSPAEASQEDASPATLEEASVDEPEADQGNLTSITLTTAAAAAVGVAAATAAAAAAAEKERVKKWTQKKLQPTTFAGSDARCHHCYGYKSTLFSIWGSLTSWWTCSFPGCSWCFCQQAGCKKSVKDHEKMHAANQVTLKVQAKMIAEQAAQQNLVEQVKQGMNPPFADIVLTAIKNATAAGNRGSQSVAKSRKDQKRNRKVEEVQQGNAQSERSNQSNLLASPTPSLPKRSRKAASRNPDFEYEYDGT